MIIIQCDYAVGDSAYTHKFNTLNKFIGFINKVIFTHNVVRTYAKFESDEKNQNKSVKDRIVSLSLIRKIKKQLFGEIRINFNTKIDF